MNLASGQQSLHTMKCAPQGLTKITPVTVPILEDPWYKLFVAEQEFLRAPQD
jgi:hypothetical protein